MLAPQVVAIYARVSSEQQADAHTIASQVAALRDRVAADGLTLAPETEFIDEGYSGATLVRPSLERLRDLAAAGGLDRLYVHSPDRLARRYAYQVLLVDELRQAGVEVAFLNRALGQTPEDDLLLQVQGMIAKYERPRSSSAVGVASAMRPPWDRSTSSVEPPTVIATCPSMRVVARPALQSCWTKPGSCVRSSPG